MKGIRVFRVFVILGWILFCFSLWLFFEVMCIFFLDFVGIRGWFFGDRFDVGYRINLSYRVDNTYSIL